MLETAIQLLLDNALESGATAPIVVRLAVQHAEWPITGDGESVEPPGEYVSVTITDQGTGITEHLRERLFQPFFSTREVGRGLGLTAVAGIARLHVGLVRLDASAAGTSVAVWIPSAAAAGEAAA